MADADRLLRDYIEAFERDGYADPRKFIAEAEGEERRRLAFLIDGYLEHGAPRQAWDPEAFEGSISERAVARAAESWSEAAGHLPVELVQLRNERRISRAKLVERLADALGVSAKREKVAAYYHQLERGLLPAAGVSSKVFDALGNLLDTTGDSLRSAGAQMTVVSDEGDEAVFARKGRFDPEYSQASRPGEAPAVASPAQPDDWDEVDELFRGAG